MAVRSLQEPSDLSSVMERVLDRIPEAVFVADGSGRLRHVNRRAGRLLGYTPPELLSLSLFDIDLSLPHAAWRGYWEAAGTGSPSPAERLYRARSGIPVLLEVTAERLDGQGEASLLLLAREPADAGGEGVSREFRTLLEQGRTTIARWDLQSRVVYMSRALEEALGVAPGSRAGTRLLDERGPAWHTLQEMFSRVLGTGRPEAIDLKFWQGPALRVEHAHFTAVRGGDGQVNGVLMVGQDVTERSMHEAVLRESEKHYRNIFEHSPDGIYVLEATEEGRFRNLDMNPALAASLGVTAEELIGRYAEDGLPAEAARTVIAKYQRCVAVGRRIEEEIRLELPAGTRWCHSTLMPVRDAGGRIHRIVGMVRDITAQKRMDRALRESEQRYREIFDNTLESVFLVEVTEEKRFRLLDINAAFELSTGLVRELAVGRPLEEGLPGPIAGVVTGECARALRSGTIYDDEVLLKLPVGARLFHCTVIPLVDGSGRVHRLIGIHRDITERRGMEAALAKREQDFRSLAESLPDNVIRYDARGTVVYANPMMMQTLGVAAEALVGRRLEAMPDSDWAKRFKAIILGGTAGSAPEEMTISLQAPSGEKRVHLVRFVTERDSSGAIAGTLAIGRDITELEQANALLHARAEAFRAMVENSPDAIARYDREGRRVFLNPAMARLFGRPLEEVLGTHVSDASPLSSEGRYSELIQAVLELGEEFQGNFRYGAGGGEQRWGHLRVVPEFGPDGTVASVLAVGRDVTGLKETERRLEESRAELRELAARRETAREEERKRLAREMHDELGQLLMALRLEITVAAHHVADAEPHVKERVDRLMGLVDRISRVVRELVADLRPAVLDMGLGPALEWLASDFTSRTGVACELRLDQCEVDLSEERLVAMFRIVQESLTNVARHAHAAAVIITLERRGRSHRLAVQDDGCGFNPAEQRKNSFGLVGVRERAMALGGRATVSSAPGAGTIVEVDIPEQP